MALLYRIEFCNRNLIVQIKEQGSRRILYLDTLKSMAKEEDREALAFLTNIHLRSPNASRSSDLSFQQIEVNAEQSLEAIRLLSKTKKLHYQKALLQFESMPVKIYWKGERHSEKACTLNAVLQIKGKEVPLENCERIFPTWCLWNQTIFPIASDIPWKWIEPFVHGPVFLQGMQKKKFLEEEPPVIWKEMSKEKPLEVFPQLELTDATGCFANLWMEYPDVGRIALEDLTSSVGGKARLKKTEEEWERDLLEAGYLRKIVGTSRYYCPGDKVRETLLFLLDLGWKLFDAQGRRILRQQKCEWDLCEEKGRIAVRGRAHFQEGAFAPLKAVLQKKTMWVELEGKRIGLLERQHKIEGEWEGETLFVKKALLPSLAPFFERGRVNWEENLHRLMEGLKQGASLDLALPSEIFRGKLLPYQQKGVNWLSFLQKWGFSGLLADEMGLGKTVQILAFFSRLRTNLPVLVVAPSSLLYHWRAEIERFLPSVKICLHAGVDRSKDPSQFEGIVITSYSIIRLDEAFFSQREFEVIVLDESNAIKTARTQIARAVCLLNSRFKVALTGTPIENRFDELWSQFRFLMPDLLEARPSLQGIDLEEVQRKVRPFILRRKKQDVEIELPEKIEQVAWVEMSEEQSRIYEEYLSKVKEGLCERIAVEGIKEHRTEILEAILRLRQICCDPRLIGSEISGTKLEVLLQDLEGKKVLIFSQFTTMLHLIGQALKNEGRDFLYLDGSVSVKERAERIDRFQKDPSASLFLLSLKAGGVGLNLNTADYVLLFDPWWNEAVEKQAIDRAHRIGQKKKVIAKRYLVPNSIEEKMLRLKEEKKAVAEQLLEEGAFNWTEEDLLRLLS